MTTERKIAKAMQGTSTAALKVLSAVPHEEFWEPNAIVQELIRLGHNLSVRVIHACLMDLTKRGLIKREEPEAYQRIKAKIINAPPTMEDLTTFEDEPPMAPRRPVTQQQETPVPQIETDPLARMVELANDARTLADMSIVLAKKIEDTALEFQSHLDKVKADSEKLKQLRALLGAAV